MFFSSVWFTWIFTHTFSTRFICSPLSVSSFCTFILFHWDFQFSLRLSKQDRTCLCSIGISYRICSNLAANFPVMGFQLRSVMSWTETNQSSIVYIWVQDIYLSNNLLLVLLSLTVSRLTPSCVILRRVKGPFAGKCRLTFQHDRKKEVSLQKWFETEYDGWSTGTIFYHYTRIIVYCLHSSVSHLVKKNHFILIITWIYPFTRVLIRYILNVTTMRSVTSDFKVCVYMYILWRTCYFSENKLN